MEAHEDISLGAQDNEDRAMDENTDDEFDDEAQNNKVEDDKDSQSLECETDSGKISDQETHLSPEMDIALNKLASRLCAICQSLCRGEVMVKSIGWPTVEFAHHPSLSSLRWSVDAGCPLCKELAQSSARISS